MLPMLRSVQATRRHLSTRSSLIAFQRIRFESTNAQSKPPTPNPEVRETIQTSSNESSQPSQSSSSSSSSTAEKQNQKSKHKLVYREIWPPFLRVLAYASAVYFSLQLTWQYLDAREQRTLEADVRRRLEEEVRKEMEQKAEKAKSDPDVLSKKARGWFSWVTGK